MQRIVAATALPNYRLHVRFADGAQGEVDLSDLVGKGVFASWRDHHAFASVSVDAQSGTVTWPGGIDLCPDTLYQDITGRSLLEGRSQGRTA